MAFRLSAFRDGDKTLNKFKRAAVVGIGLLAFSGAVVGGAQAAETPPEGKDYTVTGVSTCEEAVAKSVKELGTPPGAGNYSCMMGADGNSAELNWGKPADL